MNKLRLFITAGVLIISQLVHFTSAQSITRNQLLRLYHNGYKAIENNDVENATRYFYEIIDAAPQLPEPYLALAQLYDKAQAQDPNNIELAIYFYRNYIQTQLDDALAAEAQKRLTQLENQLEIPNYSEVMAQQQIETDNEFSEIENEVVQEMAAEEAELENQEYLADNEDQVLEDTITQKSEEPRNLTSKEEIEQVEETTDINSSEPIEPAVPAMAQVETVTAPILPDEPKVETVAAPALPNEPKVETAPVQAQPLTVSEKTKANHHLLFPIELDAERISASVIAPKQIDINELKGRWVSESRLANNREVWILDIDEQMGELRISLNPNSGLLMMPQWRKGDFEERESLLSIANDHRTITTDDDITAGTMQMFDKVKSTVASGNIADNGALNFHYDIDLTYTMTEGKRDGLRNAFKFVSNIAMPVLSAVGVDNSFVGLATNIAQNSIDNQDANDKPISYTGEIFFVLNLTDAGLIGQGREYIVEQTEEGQHEKKNRTFNTSFHKVPKYYQGNPISWDTKKSDATIKDEKAEIKRVERLSKQNPDYKYALTLMNANGVGKNFSDDKQDVKIDEKDLYKQMYKAAEKGSIYGANYLIRYCFDKVLSQSTNKSQKKKYLEVAEKFCDKFSAVAPIMVYNRKAEYALGNNNFEQALELFGNAAAKGSTYAINRLGELHLNQLEDIDSAVGYFADAAERGNADAMLNIARLFRQGRGVDFDGEMYITWAAKAYENGAVEAAKELASAYYGGLGVEPDFKKGKAYSDLYADRRSNYWKDILAEIEK